MSAFFSPFLPLLARAARAGTTTDAIITESKISFFKIDVSVLVTLQTGRKHTAGATTRQANPRILLPSEGMVGLE